jgi:5-methylcytosine-specific restriction endonuclease McrA
MTRARFYQGKAWRRLARAFMLSKSYVCERCGRPAEIAHHKAYITPQNVGDPEIALNAANLEALCLACHNAEHFGAGGAVLRGLEFDDDGNLKRRSG